MTHPELQRFVDSLTPDEIALAAAAGVDLETVALGKMHNAGIRWTFSGGLVGEGEIVDG